MGLGNAPSDSSEPIKTSSKVPQEVLATGIGADYLNEFLHLERYLMRTTSLADIWCRVIERSKAINIWTGVNYPPYIRTYFQRYVHDNFGCLGFNISQQDLINDRSKDRIPELDRRVEELNTLLSGGQEQSRARCLEIVKEMKFIVLGE